MSQWSHDGVSCLGRDVEIHIILKAFDGVVGSSGDSDRCSETKHIHSKDFCIPLGFLIDNVIHNVVTTRRINNQLYSLPSSIPWIASFDHFLLDKPFQQHCCLT